MRRMYGVDVPQLAVQFNFGDVSARIASLERELGIEAPPFIVGGEAVAIHHEDEREQG